MLVSLQAVARRDDEEEPITLLTSGRLTLEDGRSVLTYEEVLDEALPPQPITITLEDDTLMMERGGDYATQMIFRRGQRYEGQYDTPFGSGRSSSTPCTVSSALRARSVPVRASAAQSAGSSTGRTATPHPSAERAMLRR